MKAIKEFIRSFRIGLLAGMYRIPYELAEQIYDDGDEDGQVHRKDNKKV